MRHLGFAIIFLASWFALDRLGTSPPAPLSALLAIAAAGLVLAVGELAVLRTPARDLPRILGLNRTNGRALLAAGVVGTGVLLAYLGGAALLQVDLTLRANWPSVLIGLLLFHGVAEELVWRGFVFGHLRRESTFRRAVAGSMPLIAITHLPIVIDSGALVGGLAMATAAITCLPLAHLYERAGQTIWAAAILHGLIGTWQLFERSYPPSFQLVILIATMVVPLAVIAFPDRFLAPMRSRLTGRSGQPDHAQNSAA